MLISRLRYKSLRLAVRMITDGKMLGTFLFLFLICVFAGIGRNSGTEEHTERKPIKDTVRALVVYGDQYLLENLSDYDNKYVIHVRDSLEQMGYSRPLIQQLDLYIRVRQMGDEAIISTIDSLFDSPSVPYALINQINLFIANRPERAQDLVAEKDTSMYPANNHYLSWNTQIPFPYPDKLWREDSTVELRLVGPMEGGFYNPKTGVLTSHYGWRDGRNHNGIDFDLEVWDSVRTAFDGMVRVARYYGGFGRVVVIRHDNGLESLYAHLHRFKCEPGQRVQAGDVIGLGGSSGHSTGSHLHWELRYKGKPLNPETFMSFEDGTLNNDTLVLRKTKYGYAAFPKGARFHVVKKGDFLHKIAQQYGTTTNTLCELNGIKRNKVLIVGEKIRVI